MTAAYLCSILQKIVDQGGGEREILIWTNMKKPPQDTTNCFIPDDPTDDIVLDSFERDYEKGTIAEP